MPTAVELRDAFYSGSLFGKSYKTPKAASQAATESRMLGNIFNKGSSGSFDQTAYEAATKAGYSSGDINSFLKDSGVRASGSMFQVAGLGTYNGKSNTYWQVTPSYIPPASTAAPTIAPDYGNTIQQTLSLPNNGIGTIESIQPLPSQVSSPAPILGDPLGEASQRVSRQKARLSIAQ